MGHPVFLYDSSLVGDDVEGVELHADELQLLLLLIAVVITVARFEGRAIRTDYEDVDGDEGVGVEAVHPQGRGSALMVLLRRSRRRRLKAEGVWRSGGGDLGRGRPAGRGRRHLEAIV